MPDYRYVMRKAAHDAGAGTGAIVGELDLFDVSYEFVLNGYGTFSAKVAMASKIGSPFKWTKPERFVVCIERNGVLAFSGIVWTRDLDYENGVITLGGNEWGSIYDRVELQEDFEYDDFTGQVIVDLLAFTTSVLPMQASPTFLQGSGLFNEIFGVIQGSGHPTIMSILQQLSLDPVTGFDFRFTSEYLADGTLARYIVCAQPFGVVLPHAFDYFYPDGGGSISHYERTEAQTIATTYGWTADGFNAFTKYEVYAIPDYFNDVITSADLPLSGAKNYTFSDLTVADIGAATPNPYIQNAMAKLTFDAPSADKIASMGSVGDTIYYFLGSPENDGLPSPVYLRNRGGRQVSQAWSVSANGEEVVVVTLDERD